MNKDEVKPQTPEQEKPKKTHEEYLRDFAGKLNDILSEGYPLTAAIQVLDSVLFEMKMEFYFTQLAEQERLRQMKPTLQIPNMKIPTGKMK